jgi:hypothetical protein
MFLLGKLASKYAPPTMVAGFQAILLAASMANQCFFVSTDLEHHGGMMRGGGVGAEGGIGAGGEVFCLIQFLALSIMEAAIILWLP